MINQVVQAVGYILLGCIFGVLFSNYEYFILDNTIEAGDLLSLVITTLIGLYIAKNIQRQHNSDRKEKDFIIEEIQTLRKDIQVLINEKGIYDFDYTKSAIKDINLQLHHINTLLALSTYCTKVKTSSVGTIFKVFRESILQNSPVNNLITLNGRQRATTKKSYSDLIKEMYKLILNINNS